MKRDLKLCQEILLRLERDKSLENTDETAYHLLLLEDAGFIDLSGSHLNYMRNLGTRFLPKIARLTWRGHEVLGNMELAARSGGASDRKWVGNIWDV